jgi:DTW domain-containing protein YfiP
MIAECEVRRLLCQRCHRSEKTCICHWITDISPLVEVVILQHPFEQKQAKGSASLLQLSLRNCQIHVGELFDSTVLFKLLHAGGKMPVLLYPAFNESDRHIICAPPPLSEQMLVTLENCRLIVLDGTWRKSRKMLYLNRSLQNFPRFSLREMPSSRYSIRKAHSVDQLSTLEASCYALMQLEKNTEKYAPLLDAFDGFVRQQSALREKYRVNNAA